MRKRAREFNRKGHKNNVIASKDVDVHPHLLSWSALEEHLQHKPKSIKKIAVRSHNENKLWQLLGQYGQVAIPVSVNDEMGSPIQAELSLEQYSEDEFFEALERNKPKLILVLDQVTDTRNLGSIARSAAFFGIPWIVMPRDRQASITTATLSTAQGAFAHVNPVNVVNLSRTLERLKSDLNIWVIGTAMEGEPVHELSGQYEHAAIVLGNEAKGMRPLTTKKCDRIVTIPGHKTRVESLNIAVAAGICFHELSTLR